MTLNIRVLKAVSLALLERVFTRTTSKAISINKASEEVGRSCLKLIEHQQLHSRPNSPKKPSLKDRHEVKEIIVNSAHPWICQQIKPESHDKLACLIFI
jgi:hypothetical protein